MKIVNEQLKTLIKIGYLERRRQETLNYAGSEFAKTGDRRNLIL